MKSLALAAAGAALLGLAACSQTAAPTAATATHRALRVPISCGQQYRTWQNGPGEGLIAALHAVSVAGTAGNAHVLTVALRRAQPIVVIATRHPMPACADPRGFWTVLLMHVNAAVAGRHSPSSVGAAIKGMPEIERELTAEVRQMTG